MEPLEFSCIRNHVAEETFVSTEPWDSSNEDKPPYHLSKNKFRAWCRNNSIDHAFISTYVGKAPSARISKDNPVNEIRGMVIDFDVPHKLGDWKIPEGSTPPNFYYQTQSGGVRFVYVFERPVFVPCPKFLERFRKEFLKTHAPDKIIAGFDVDAYSKSYTYYEVGYDWVDAGVKPISRISTEKIVREAIKSLNWASSTEGVEVPYDVLADKLSKKYPDVDFDSLSYESGRTTRFFDSGDARSAILTPRGIVCFTSDEAFVPYSDPRLLGPSLIKELAGTKISQACDNLAYVKEGGHFYQRGVDGWGRLSGELLKIHLTSAKNLSRSVKRGSESSEVEDCLEHIRTFNAYHGVAPFLYEGKDTVRWDGRKFLNNSHVKPMTPHPHSHEWGEKFPRLARYLEDVFPDDDNFYGFLHWTAHAVQSAVHCKPSKGLGLVICGKPSVGKGFIIDGLVGQMLGGCFDASSYMIKDDQFNDKLIANPLWTLHDPEDSRGNANSKHATKLMKRLIANPSITCRAMQTSPVTMPMRSRVVMTINDDITSLESFPTMETSVLSKLMVLHARTSKEFLKSFPTDEELRNGELPHLMAFLLSLEIPEELRCDRFGVTPFFDPIVERKVQNNSTDYDRMEIIRAFVSDLHDSNSLEIKVDDEGKNYIQGTGSSLFENMSHLGNAFDEAFPTVRVFTKTLGQMKDNPSMWWDCGISVEGKRTSTSRLYRITIFNPKDHECLSNS